ncbi:MAG: flavodoxin [Pseudoxanthomonas sp.]
MTTSSPDAGRRTVITALASLQLGCAAGTSANAVSPHRTDAKTLVAYFSRSGNTRVVAGLLHRRQESDLFEIRPAQPYPDDYLETVAQARRERDEGFEPALLSSVANMAGYGTIYLGFPIWGETAPPIIRSLLSRHDMRGKDIVPFITHGGFGPGNSLRVLANHAPDARILEAFILQADQERKTMDSVNGWLSTTLKAQ